MGAKPGPSRRGEDPLLRLLTAQAVGGLAARRLTGPGPGRRCRDGAVLRLVRQEIQFLAVVDDRERLAVVQQVPGLGVGHLDAQAPAPDEDGEREPGEALGEPRREADPAVRMAHATEAGDQGRPGAGQ